MKVITVIMGAGAIGIVIRLGIDFLKLVDLVKTMLVVVASSDPEVLDILAQIDDCCVERLFLRVGVLIVSIIALTVLALLFYNKKSN